MEMLTATPGPGPTSRVHVAARRSAFLAAAVLVSGLLVACGSIDAAPAPSQTESGEQTTESDAVTSDGCDTVSDDAVAAVLDAEVVRREPFAEAGVVGCTKGPEQTSTPNFVNVYVLTGVGIADLTDGEGTAGASVPVDGVGDRAVYLAGAGSLIIEDGGDALSIQVYRAGLPGSLEDCVAIANDMLSRRG